MIRFVYAAILATALSACASNQPIVYQGGQAQSGNQAAVETAVADCRQQAEAAGANPYGSSAGTAARRTAQGAAVGAATGAVGGAIAGNAGRGAGIGAATGAAATLIHSLFNESAPNPAYRAYVERCLRDRGYELAGWK